MAQKAPDVTFTSEWNKAAAWAQSLGIPASDYKAVYDLDANRLLTGEYPMSVAERSRAILAAQNPNNVTPVPSDHPSPWAFLGNSITDLRNIFTGLAPNHLIPNVFHTVGDAILHPSTWVDPLEDVGKGIASGNLGDIRKGLELAGGQNSVLSWVPGVYDLSELAQGGWKELLEHPIISLLDVAPFAPAGKVLSLAADDARLSTIAKSLNMTSDQLRKASLPKLGTAWILAKDFASRDPETGAWVARYPGTGRLAQTLVGPDGKPISVGSAIKGWADSHTGLSRTAALLMGSAFDLRGYGTDADVFVNRPLAVALQKLDSDQKAQLYGLIDRTDPRAKGKLPAQIMGDSSIDPAVRTAYDKMTDALSVGVSRAWAAGGLVQIEGPDYTRPDGTVTHDTDVFSATGQTHPVVQAARKNREAMNSLLEAMKKPNEISNEVRAADREADKLVTQVDQSRTAALSAGEKTMDQLSVPVEYGRNGKVTRSVSIDVARQARLVFGDDGVVARLTDALSTVDSEGKPKPRDFETAKALAAEAEKALSHDGYASVNAGRDPAYEQVLLHVKQLGKFATRRAEREREFLKLLTDDTPKGLKTALRKATLAYREFDRAWWDNPPDRWRSVLKDKKIDAILERGTSAAQLEKASARLRDRNLSERDIQSVLTDPKRLAEFIYHDSEDATTNLGSARILNREDLNAIAKSATDEVNKLRQQGHEVAYVPVISSLDVLARDPGRYGVGITKDAKVRPLRATQGREMRGFVPERYDMVAAITLAAREAIQRDITIEFVENHLVPHAMTGDDVAEWAWRAFPDEFARRDADLQTERDLLATHVATRMGLTAWDPTGQFGFSFPRWSGKKMFLPKVMEETVTKMLAKGVFPADGIIDKATGLFRMSILGLSPRYTAHIVFGGAFLLALRSDPRIVTKIPEAYRMMKDGKLPVEIRRTATELGKEPIEQQTFKVAASAANHAGGKQMGDMLVQEGLSRDGIDWRKANPVQWAKAAADLNFRFTNSVATMQRTLAFLDGSDKAYRTKFHDPETGEEIAMTPQRARYEGIQHALKVMGDLKAMTPLERSVFTKVFPFYGWTRHILTYVSTYPVDHPFRAQFLTVLAEQNSDSVASALDKRIQFLFFLGSPDAAGNVSAIDVRFLDPLRDVANYATWGGFISSLNPVLSIPFAAWNPEGIYGQSSLYPNVTYDQFYGIETSATPSGSWLTGVEQVVPQVTALDATLNLSGQYRQLGIKNPNSFAKTIFEALNVPFAQVQSLNMKQLAAKGEIARYNVAKAAASNAFQSGDFSLLNGYASVPNPLNPDYETTPAALQSLYDEAMQAYPGQAPSESLAPPPAPPGL